MTGSGLSVLVIDRLALVSTVVVSVSLSLAATGSAVELSTLTVQPADRPVERVLVDHD